MKWIASFVLVMLSTLGLQAQDCEGVPSPKEYGETTTFYAYAYHTNRYNQELRVSPIFRVTYNFDPKSGVNQVKIALRLSQDFQFFVRNMRDDDTHTSNPIANSTQQKGSLICMNRAAIVEHRAQMIEEFEAMEKPILEENGYNFEYKFNKHYKATTKVSAVKM